ncbi:MAG: dienelactone hydrolase family protein [Roseibium sp.]|uniref:dienelactone hydrolase family protein n=1 Tax=Roseibium sp. TaxID=1936156 RepID=UPI00260CCAB2|nr:dienelactone hydrolase family protein [Roseibium sp.]MCV0427182.1 dienelactone hydrolase family protein [Roseibium sp.]
MQKSENLIYFDGESELEGLVCYPERSDVRKLPLVIISHPWLGIDDFVQALAQKIASLGYVAFAIDIYGKGIRGKEHSDGHRLKQPFLDNPELLLRRLRLGYEKAVSLDRVDTGKVSAIGHCFGGLCVLEMAKLETNLSSIISVHGVISEAKMSPTDYNCEKAFVINGAADPLVKPGALEELQEHLTRCNVDWTVINFGRGGHAFTNPKADGSVPGIKYDPDLDARTWAFVVESLRETLD